MKNLQKFLGLVQDFIVTGERYVTGMSTVGGVFTYTYDPDAREFQATEDTVVKFYYNDFTKQLVNNMEGEDIQCAIESMADVMAELTGKHFRDFLVGYEVNQPYIRPKKVKVNYGQMLEDQIKRLINTAPKGFNIVIDEYRLCFTPMKGWFSIIVDDKYLAGYNALNLQGYHNIPDSDFEKVTAVLDKAMKQVA
ncbi:hypothetical protein D9M71_536480 [compost metagenome]